MSPDVAVIQAAIGIAVLLPACYFDVRKREIPNFFWWALGISGIVLTVYSMIERGFQGQYVMFAIGSVLIFWEILISEFEHPIYKISIFAAITICFVVPSAICFDVTAKQCIMIYVTYVFILLLYRLGIVKGGADAKCLITLSMLVQTCPSFGNIPLISVPPDAVYFFPFAVMVLFHAALFTLFALFWIVLRKVIRKKDPVKLVTLSCYTMSIEEARKSFVWSMQDVKGGKVVNVKYIPDDGVYDRLEAAGAKEVWVTPIIPFIVPITAAFVFIAVVGNLLFIPFGF